MDGLRIERLDDRTYRLTGSAWAGQVDADLEAVAEDDGDFLDPSALYIGGVGGT